jgi:hypothetical protein
MKTHLVTILLVVLISCGATSKVIFSYYQWTSPIGLAPKNTSIPWAHSQNKKIVKPYSPLI